MNQFLLSTLEAYDGVILERGREYVFDRRVADIQEVSPGEFTTVVDGSERFDMMGGFFSSRAAPSH